MSESHRGRCQVMKYTILFASLILSACSPYVHRGEFSLVSTESIVNRYELLSKDKISGQACFNFIKTGFFVGDEVFELATKDALSKVEGATVLLDAEFKDKGSCVVVTGTPAK